MSATQLSGFRLMWIFVMFDLPVGTKAEMRAATKFREYLLDEGFEKSQFSVYARFCNGRNNMRLISAASSRTCRTGGTSMCWASPTASMKTSSDSRGNAAAGSAKTPTSWRCSDDLRRFGERLVGDYPHNYNKIATHPS